MYIYMYFCSIYRIYLPICAHTNSGLLGGPSLRGGGLQVLSLPSTADSQKRLEYVDIDLDIDIDVDIDVSIDVDTDLDIDLDVDIDVDIDLDTDLDIDVDIDNRLQKLEYGPGTIYAGFHSPQGFGGIPTFWLLLETEASGRSLRNIYADIGASYQTPTPSQGAL